MRQETHCALLYWSYFVYILRSHSSYTQDKVGKVIGEKGQVMVILSL